MSKKIIIIAVILLAGLIALVLLKGEGGVSVSSGGSPEAVVKNFFEAVKKGDFEKAEKHISLESDSSVASFFCETVIGSRCTAMNLSKTENKFLETESLTLLGKAIDNIKIENKQTEKAFGIEQAVIVVRINFKSGAREEAERKFEEEKKKPPLRADIRTIVKNGFVANFSEKAKITLEKYEQGWKIIDVKF